MSADWAAPYEAHTGLSESTALIGVHPRRQTLWTLVGAGALILFGVLALLTRSYMVLTPIGFWLVFCQFMAHPLGGRTPEYWWKRWLRFRRLPRDMDQAAILKHHVSMLDDTPRGVVEITTTRNLAMTDEDALGSQIKKLHKFYLQLRFPVQIVVRAWPNSDGITRRWFVAVLADNDVALEKRLQDIVNGLKRAGLGGEIKRGDLTQYVSVRGRPERVQVEVEPNELADTIQECWTTVARNGHIGPQSIHREQWYSIVDGEYVRGLLLNRVPRAIDANCLASVLDGELPIDLSMWLEPLDNTGEANTLAARLNDLETAQVLNVGNPLAGSNGVLGYRDPDLDDEIVDIKTTRKILRHRLLRVFVGTFAFVVRGTEWDEMNDRERQLVDQLREMVGDTPVLPADFEQDLTPLMVVPTGISPVTYPLRIESPALARIYPFSNSCVSMDGGPDCGTSIGSRRTNRLNLFGLVNPHMVVLGTTGAGKGYWIKVYLYRLMQMFWQAYPGTPDELVNVRVIQTEKDEYTTLARRMGPQRAEVVRIDRFEDLPRLLYPESAIAPWGRTLRPFRQYAVFDLTHIETLEERGRCMAWLLRELERTMTLRPRPKHEIVVIDELGIVIESEAAAKALEVAYRRFRSLPMENHPEEIHRIAMLGASQRPTDLLRHPRGKVLADLTDTRLYLRQRDTEVRTVKGQLSLSQAEADFLETCADGDALLVAGNARVGLHLHATNEEHEFART